MFVLKIKSIRGNNNRRHTHSPRALFPHLDDVGTSVSLVNAIPA